MDKDTLRWVSTTITLCCMTAVTVAAVLKAPGQSENLPSASSQEMSQIERNGYPVNESGQTYGSASQAQLYGERPDLIRAIGECGVSGYIYQSDLEEGYPKTPEEALAQQQRYEELAAQTEPGEPVVVQTIPLYDADGKTVLGEFHISFTKGNLI